MQINFYPALKVWFLPAGSSVEESAKHEAPKDAAAIEWAATDLLDQHERRGDEVIQIRFVRNAIDPGTVLYANRSYIEEND